MLVAAALAAMPGVAQAQQKFPTKPILRADIETFSEVVRLAGLRAK